MKKLLLVVLAVGLLTSHCRAVAGAAEVADVHSRRLAGRGSDDHGTGRPHDHDPRTTTQPDHHHGQALQPGRGPGRRDRVRFLRT